MHTVYVIQHDVDKGIYIGTTSDLRKRLAQHNTNSNRSTIRKNGKWVLIYLEVYRVKKDALIRELRLKQHGSGKNELYKRIKNSML